MEEFYHLTTKGKNQFKYQLQRLQSQYKELIIELKNAYSNVISENGDDAIYLENRRRELAQRIFELNHIIKKSKAVHLSKKAVTTVQLGVQVKLTSAQGEMLYRIVESIETNPEAGKISDVSPIGQALLGKHINDEVDVPTPAGLSHYKIAQITA